ncbi:MAG: tRNA uridine(34) 5-carboxymethylaminomethyl modification radical SAM/GNAT enzyme Elp3 [Candidatus Pacebacteria bacterium]|nr:tRNA uridine(34) 5-carboxymethylaminomethyl modification radical SAM/GNAT enzyme Elp3 [Candidatus Paceibacterota bacterium]
MQKPLESLIIEAVKNKTESSFDLNFLKRKFAKRFKIETPSNIELLKAYHNLVENKRIKTNQRLKELLVKRRIRSLSGVVTVSVLTKPYKCPGKCLYCPNEKGIPKSYLSNEPAVMRAVLNKFDPYSQVKTRIKSLELTGHATDKIELIIIGGTWSYLNKKYQEWFIKKCFEAANNKRSDSLKKVQEMNEKAKHRIIGITVETRPDFIDEKEIKNLRKLGVTRVEIGVQSIYDDVLKLNKRGHKRIKIIKATQLLKDAGFKVCYHIMLNLLGSSPILDKKMFEEIFNNPDFRPDLLKIYPCAILKQAPLYRLYRKGAYKPYDEKQLINLLKEIKKKIPYYVRVQRLIRDIPSQSIIIGPAKISNMRQILKQARGKENWHCKCIRCREVKESYDPKTINTLKLFREDYNASGAKEIFLSYEDKSREKLYSLLRLRIPLKDKENPFSVLKSSAIIREVHTYGRLNPIGHTLSKSPQHKGFGKKLIEKAEKIAKEEFGLNKIAVISGIGVRGYYRKLGYTLKDSYMVKRM